MRSKVCWLGLGSDPLTAAPLSSSMRAKPLMPLPPMPMKWTRRPVNRLLEPAERDSVRNSLTALCMMDDMIQPRGYKGKGRANQPEVNPSRGSKSEIRSTKSETISKTEKAENSKVYPPGSFEISSFEF